MQLTMILSPLVFARPNPAERDAARALLPSRRKRPPSTLIDLHGQRFDRLVVIERAGTIGKGVAAWRCRCDCGNECIARSDVLRRHEKKSCGCKPRSSKPSASKPRSRKPRKATTGLRHPGAARRVLPPKPEQAVAGSSRGLDDHEAAAVEAALRNGKLTRVPNGSWPDAGRPELLTIRSPVVRAKLAAAREDAR